ncbi:MAG: hypothetical protein Fur0010_19090 [Bdellovibrio sp.]
MFTLICRILFIFISCTSIVLSPKAMAQDGRGDDDILGQSVSDLIIVAGAGAGGAILGLSTLSFVEEPSEHLKNVLVGGAIGIIVGVGVVAYKQATKSHEVYNQVYRPLNPKEFSTIARTEWHLENHKSHQSQLDNDAFSLQFSF